MQYGHSGFPYYNLSAPYREGTTYLSHGDALSSYASRSLGTFTQPISDWKHAHFD